MDVEAIKDRGRKMGLQAPRAGISLSMGGGWIWQDICAKDVKVGDIWALHGKVVAAERHGASMAIVAGLEDEEQMIRADSLIKVFRHMEGDR